MRGESIAYNIEAGRTITFIMCRPGRRDTAFQVARRMPDQDIMRRYRMAVRLAPLVGRVTNHKAMFKLQIPANMMQATNSV